MNVDARIDTATVRADLARADLRTTAQRVAVLVALREERRHWRLEALTDQVRRRLGSVSTQAVYDAVDALVGAGLARRIEPAGSPALVEARAGDNHHHLVCRRCGTVVDVDCAVGATPCLTPSDAAGFAVDEAEVVFWGLCPTCQRTDPSTGPTPDPIARSRPPRRTP